MEDTKKWYESKGIWGSVVAVAAIAAGFFGFDFGADMQTEVVEKVTAVVGAGGALWALWGRVKATKTIN